MANTIVDPFAAMSGATSSSSTSSAKSDTAAADRFLKLLVAQLENQDPMNPMDNAQMTSQMAQINTVSGIQQLNATVSGLNAQFVQMQALQGAALVGRDVTVAGNSIAVGDDLIGRGGFELDGTADRVNVEVLSPAGRVVDTLQLGAMQAGRHDFEWPGAATATEGNYTFRVSASAGAQTVTSTALMRDRVASVSTEGGTLTLDLERSGEVAYGDVKAFN
jgi:flagellar basal-body rod modification protein FlgD